MLPYINADHFTIFLDTTGKPFTQFMNSVLRASAAKLGIPPTDVHTNLRVSVPDGGIDSQIDKGADDPNGYLARPTVWQYKARKFSEITEAVLHNEIEGSSKENVRELIRRGYAYRLCICEDSDPSRKLAMQQKLDGIIKDVYPSAPPNLVLLPSDIAEWANHYPAVVARCLGLPADKFRYFQSWRASAVAETPTFVPPESYGDLNRRVAAHLDWSQKPSEVALTVYGDAGTGKTRSVFEALDSQTNQRELVLYTTDEQAAIEIATALTNDDTPNAILVADECLSQARFRLSDILRGSEKRVRLITIDNAKERNRTLAPELLIRRATDQETLNVLSANFDPVPLERRLKYAAIAGGFLRFAIYVCAHDSEIQEAGTLSPALKDAHSYYEYRFSGRFGFIQEDREALEIVALVDRVGYRGDKWDELDILCKIVHQNPQDTRKRIERIRTQTGLISSAGRFYYVTPAPIAMIAFESAWDRWAAADPVTFLKQIPEELIQAFQDRVSSAPSEVGAIVGRFFRDWTIAKGAQILGSESDTRRLVALVAADPKTQAPLLRTLVESARRSQIKGDESGGFPFGGITPRRLIVSVAEELAQFSDFFADAEAILFRLALHETEPSIGNNATNTWKGLFRIYLSGTDMPFAQRYQILKQHLSGNKPEEKKLAVSAAAAAIDRNAVRTVGPPLFGSLVPPKEWQPRTHRDYFDAIRDSMSLLLAATSDLDPDVSIAAKDWLLSAATHLLWAGLIEPVREALEGKLTGDMRPRMAALVRESYSRTNHPDVRDTSLQARTNLETWLISLESKTLHGRLIENIAAEPWNHHFEEQKWRTRVVDLAQDLYENPDAFTEELGWLNSNQAKAAAEIGHFLGLRDGADLRLLDQVVNSAIEEKADALARGYFYGLTLTESRKSERIGQALDRIQAVNPPLAFYVMLPAGDLVKTFKRAMSMVAAGQVAPRLLSNLLVWVGNRKTTPEEAADAVNLLLPMAKSGDSEAGTTAIDFIAYQLHGASDDQELILTQMFGAQLKNLWALLGAVVLNPGRQGHWFATVLLAAASFNPERSCKIGVAMLLSDSLQFAQEGEGTLAQLAHRFPEEMMEAIGAYVTADESKNQFFLRKFTVFTTLPVEVVTTWLQRVGVNGARAIARHLPRPFLDQSGTPKIPPLTEFVLTRFEDDDRTFREFVNGTHSFQLYRGSYASAREHEALQANPFLTSPLRRIREWAQLEIRQAQEDVTTHRISEEELNSH
jgi:hypothetical protein